jgi:ABC-type nickel/cobalt efflux system permease component RcnA
MYCSSCGVAVASGLSYCNYCGAKLNGTQDGDGSNSSELRPGYLVFAMMAVFVFGLVAITMLIGVMKTVLAFNEGAMLAFTLLSFLMLLLIESVFVWLLFRTARRSEQTATAAIMKRQATKELDAAQARELPEPRPSVTEHTTRTFAPIHDERSSK